MIGHWPKAGRGQLLGVRASCLSQGSCRGDVRCVSCSLLGLKGRVELPIPRVRDSPHRASRAARVGGVLRAVRGATLSLSGAVLSGLPAAILYNTRSLHELERGRRSN